MIGVARLKIDCEQYAQIANKGIMKTAFLLHLFTHLTTSETNTVVYAAKPNRPVVTR